VNLLIRQDGTGADEDEEEKGDELRQRALECVWRRKLISLTYRKLHHLVSFLALQQQQQ
jgi:hypothetical protein